MSKILFYCCFLLSMCCVFHLCALKANADSLPPFFNGITLENLVSPKPNENFDDVIRQLGKLSVPVVVRVVFQGKVAPSQYVEPLRKLTALNTPTSKKVYVMGLLLDSQALKEYKLDKRAPLDCPGAYSRFRYQNRVECYVNELDEWVDIWEVGNEVNGEWADEGDDTVKKINLAIAAVKNKNRATGKNKPTALTLIHQPKCKIGGEEVSCRKRDREDMFFWSDKYLLKKSNNFQPKDINYLLVSYYEDNCDKGICTVEPPTGSQPLPGTVRLNNYWNGIFHQLAVKFKDIKNFGFGEVGFSDRCVTCPIEDPIKDKDRVLYFCKKNTKIEEGSKLYLMKKYYGLDLAIKNQPEQKYIGGYFWWNGQEDVNYEDFYSSLISHFKP